MIYDVSWRIAALCILAQSVAHQRRNRNDHNELTVACWRNACHRLAPKRWRPYVAAQAGGAKAKATTNTRSTDTPMIAEKIISSGQS